MAPLAWSTSPAGRDLLHATGGRPLRGWGNHGIPPSESIALQNPCGICQKGMCTGVVVPLVTRVEFRGGVVACGMGCATAVEIHLSRRNAGITNDSGNALRNSPPAAQRVVASAADVAPLCSLAFLPIWAHRLKVTALVLSFPRGSARESTPLSPVWALRFSKMSVHFKSDYKCTAP